MSDQTDQDSKTEAPTEKKIQDALDKGNVPHSREAAIVASMAGMLVVAALWIGDALTRLAGSLSRFIEQPGEWRLGSPEDGLTLIHAVFADSSSVLWPVFAVLMVAGLSASLLQNTPSIVFERIRPKLSKLSLAQGVKRTFGKQGAVEFAKAVAKLMIVTVVAGLILKSELPAITDAVNSDVRSVPGQLGATAVRLLAGVTGISVLLAVADLVWSRHHWRRDLMMTRQEIKDEMKQSDGDPLVKSRLRSLARERARKRMMSSVPNATLVIANPTHFAIALRFVRATGGAPVVVAKGKNLLALKIREIAEANDIPVVEDKPLARSMYDLVEVDREIPEDFYKAVAEVIFYLSTHNRAKAMM